VPYDAGADRGRRAMTSCARTPYDELQKTLVARPIRRAQAVAPLVIVVNKRQCGWAGAACFRLAAESGCCRGARCGVRRILLHSLAGRCARSL